MISSFRISARNIFNSSRCWSSRVAKTFEENQARLLKRMLDNASKRKSKQMQPKLLEKEILPSAYGNTGRSKRVQVLNKVYMEQIILMLDSGKYGSQFSNLGIEITKVNMSSALNFLSIYWISRRDDVPQEVLNDTLHGALQELQQQMGGVRFTSKVPLLKFVKDIRLEREIQLDKVFDSADFGKDFDQIHGKKVFTADFIPEAQEVPEMRQNVLGLDHAKIKSRIQAEIKRLKAINTGPHDTEYEEVEHELPQKIIRFDKKEFFKFYKRRRILIMKMKKKIEQENAPSFVEDGDNYDEMEEGMNEDEDEDEYENEYEDVDEDEYENENEDRNRFRKS